MLREHKQKCREDNITTLRFSSEPHLHRKNHFHKNALYFRLYADFEADNEIDNSSIGNKSTSIYKQNPVLKGYQIESELENVLKSGCYKFPLGYNKVDSFVDEVIKLEIKIAVQFVNANKDTIRTAEDEKVYRNKNVCRFCEKNVECDKVRNHCHLTGKYRDPAHSICNIIVTHEQSNLLPFIFHNFSTYDCLMFFKNLVYKKNDKVKLDIIPKANEDYKIVTYECISFIDSNRFLSSSLDPLVKTKVNNSHKTFKKLKNK